MSASRLQASRRRRILSSLTALALLPGTALTAAAAPVAAGGADGLSGSWLGSWRDSNTVGTNLYNVRNMIRMGWGPSYGFNGRGVGIAMIDTGVAPVPQLSSWNIYNGPDLSFESQSPNLRYMDTFGHGTHMAGIMVGSGHTDGHLGIANYAKLTSIKVGTANGAVDVSQVVAGIDWVVKNKNHDPANPIRVLNLSYGTGGNPSSLSDPLHFAVEQAWKAGIVVVAAAGNEYKSVLASPATDPFVLSVGSAWTRNTTTNADDLVSGFTNGKKAARPFDVVAPGEGILSVRNPGSNIDLRYPGARVGDTVFRGSGTSQAAAVTSGAIAVLLQARPSLTPDQVKQLLKNTGTPLSGADSGHKILNINAAFGAPVPTSLQRPTSGSGKGLLEHGRGAGHVVNAGTTLSGERSVWGAFSSGAWAPKAAARTSWAGGVWMGTRLAGDGWTGSSWASKTWAPATWAGTSFGGAPWADPAWSGRYWSGRYWSGGNWEGRYWSSSSWYSTL